jgi:DNA repair protein RadC
MTLASQFGKGETLEGDGLIEYHPTIKDLPATERPRERLEHYGAEALSTGELLAIILRTGVGGLNVLELSNGLLAQHRGLVGLAHASFPELCQTKGIGRAKVTQLKAALELGRRLLVTTPQARPQVRSPADAANLLLGEMGLLEQEHLRTLLLDTKNHVLASPTIYVGSVNTTMIRVAEIFREAIKANCAGIIVAHNHPSGDPTPSPEDISVTEQIVAAGKLLDIEVLDHLVIGHQRYVSLKERGLGFS